MNDLKKLISSKIQDHLSSEIQDEANSERSLSETSSFERFVDQVVADVFLELRKTHQIPMGHGLSDLREELKEEVIESTRKKIYGYHDIKQYKKAFKKA